jgi:hypothetical protein
MAERSEPFKLEQAIVTNWNNGADDEMTAYLRDSGRLKGRAVNVGSVQYTTSKIWQAAGGFPKSFGKTDLTIGKANISLKSSDNHLIFSGAKGESKALFITVANVYYKKRLNAIVEKVIRSLDDMVSSSVTPSTIGKAKKTDKLVMQAAIIHEAIKKEIVECFNSDVAFSHKCIIEMLAGELKFGRGEAVAEYLLYTEPKLMRIDDPRIFDQVNIDFRVDFKSNSIPTARPLGSYRFWSVCQTIWHRLGVSEGIMDDTKKYVRNLLTTLKYMLTSDWNEFLDFMELRIVQK